MARVKGIFEPFKPYIRKQLEVRKEILANLNEEGTILNNARFNEKPELFYAYSTEKQCTIRMMSGVDIRPESYKKALEIDDKIIGVGVGYLEDEKYLMNSSNLAKQYILEGGTRYYNDKTKWGWRGGFTTGVNTDDHIYAFSYGDKNVRANPDGDYGAVPMPGILNATIKTKSQNGALREAQVNFICFNRRQLAALEMLYMRPGFPVCLEWGWNPYISNSKNRETLDYTVKKEFFKSTATLDSLNDKIRFYKEKAGGNYDGFVGYVKNFQFKAREDGGFDCTTEIVAHGEILESLKSPGIKTHRISDDLADGYYLVETTDRLLFYLRALKHQFNSDGSQIALQRLIIDEDAIYNDSEESKNLKKVPTPPNEYTGAQLEAREDELERLQKQNQSQLNSETLNQSRIQNAFDGDQTLTVDMEKFSDEGIDRNDFLKNIKTILSEKQLKNFLEEGTIDKNNLEKLFRENDSLAKSNYQNIVSDRYFAMDNTYVDFDYRMRARSSMSSDQESAVDSLNSRKDAWNNYIRIYSLEQDIKVPVEYRVAYGDIARLYKYINKETSKVETNLLEKYISQGFESLLGGAILRQTIKYPEYVKYDYADMGETVTIKKRKFWWDKTKDIKTATSTEYDSGRRRQVYIRWDLVVQMINHLSNTTAEDMNKKLAIIYGSDKGKLKNKKGLSTPLLELTYLNDNSKTWNNNDPSNGKTDNGKNYSYIEYQPCVNYLADPAKDSDLPRELEGKYHPIIGNSFDERICLMPHQKIFDEMFESDRVHHSTYFEFDEFDNEIEEKGSEEETQTVNLRTINSYKSKYKAKDMRTSIGFVYFNLDYLLDTYEGLRLKRGANPNGTTSTYITLNENFALFDFVSSLWQGVNDATGGYYNFQLHTEHEQPNKARIVDMRLSGDPDDNIFKFDPQGLKSVTRQFFFDSKIDSNMAAAISIAAQAPNNEQSLDSLSFKAFHQNIKSRFILNDHDQVGNSFIETPKDLADKKFNALKDDIIDFNYQYNLLIYYMKLMNNSNYDTVLKTLQPSEAVTQARRFIELRANILHRFPLYLEDGETKHPKAGFFRKGTTLESNAIIPLQCNLQLDGIAGLIPLQLFKIASDKLPKGYDRKDIAFIIKSESQTITDAQDWVTEITGQLALLNTNPNNDGVNNIFEYTDPPEVVNETLTNAEFLANTPWADLLRDVIDELGHYEKSYVKGNLVGTNEDSAEAYRLQLIDRELLTVENSPELEVLSGELASGDDIQPDMSAFGMILLRCMDDEDYANRLVLGENYATEVNQDSWYTNGNALKDVKLMFTAGNDIEHYDPKYSGTRHVDGRALDFVVYSHSIKNVTQDIILDSFDLKASAPRNNWNLIRKKAKKFAKLANINYRYYKYKNTDNNKSYYSYIKAKAYKSDSGFKTKQTDHNINVNGWMSSDRLYAKYPTAEMIDVLENKTKNSRYYPRYAETEAIINRDWGRDDKGWKKDNRWANEANDGYKFWDKTVENQYFTYHFFKLLNTKWYQSMEPYANAQFEILKNANLIPILVDNPRIDQEKIRKNGKNNYFKGKNSRYQQEWHTGQFFEESGARILNRIVKLLLFLHTKFPNSFFIDEYRKPGKVATGFHFHIFSPYNKEIVPLDKLKLSANQLKLQDRETKLHPSGWSS